MEAGASRAARHADPWGPDSPEPPLAAAFSAAPLVGIPLLAFFFWPALLTLSDRFAQAPWPAWAALAALVLMSTAVFPAIVYRWAIELERGEADFRKRRAAIILGALHRRTEGAKPAAASDRGGV